ncbi:CBS domain-containing protein [Rhodoblastus acidophilus]|uniref:CBS domain-containing protein n=1 Tax=Candidatus Rhodoblastus alkanivorans TaxID=2954117 RepID=A0ABS9Z2H7_9HYPH|nr:CBS domain-containing protein [Candidatus Rhodoblastus alkanivorans]MCI4677520.1 CBS domain-containing protein [Candidatus Rhodoblastus alkanivorans]MCI4681879.1 CBS domain-containing protein [Candidatus Rhodoblastus alkanivorans]MDI4642929.1 CBS domain-containing protein [Rhodoblastus acidophilus]
MTTIKQILQEKGGDVASISPDATVFDAIKAMAEQNIGALVVIEAGRVVGLITERAYAREVVLKGRTSPTTAVRAVMETDLPYARPEQLVEECMAVMTRTRLRHMPVFSDGELVGLISMGDLVKSIIGNQEFTIEQLLHYIHS